MSFEGWDSVISDLKARLEGRDESGANLEVMRLVAALEEKAYDRGRDRGIEFAEEVEGSV